MRCSPDIGEAREAECRMLFMGAQSHEPGTLGMLHWLGIPMPMGVATRRPDCATTVYVIGSSLDRSHWWLWIGPHSPSRCGAAGSVSQHVQCASGPGTGAQSRVLHCLGELYVERAQGGYFFWLISVFSRYALVVARSGAGARVAHRSWWPFQPHECMCGYPSE